MTSLEAMTLAGLADRPRYAYELVQRISELTNGRMDVRPGNLYRVLERFVNEGLVREVAAPTQDADDRRRYFMVTRKGAERAAEELSMYATVLRRVSVLREALNDA